MILLDSLLPDGTGRDFLDFLNENGWDLSNIPIVSMSGNPVCDQENEYRDYKIKAFFQKPLKYNTIKGLHLLAK